MRYTLLLHYPEMTAEELGPDGLEAGQVAFRSFAAALHAAGALISAEVLQPSTASTTLTAVDGTLRIQDGPYAATKEQLGGTFVIDVPDLDAALAWAEQAPSVQWGTVEVRPSATHTVDGQWTPWGES
jgi:hypothetical protein